MDQLPEYLMLTSAAIIFILGLLHFVYTFFSSKLRPRDTELQERMNQVSPVISRETTMWSAWIGFNASHSFGALLYGLVFGYLALRHFDILFGSPFLQTVGLSLLIGYTLLAKKYWFSIPFRGIVLALITYIGSIATSLA